MADRPPVTSDFYDLEALLDEQDRDALMRVRAFMDEQVEPIINEYWTRAQFPRQLIPGLAELGIAGAQYSGYGCPGRSSLFDGMVSMELGRGDPSAAPLMRGRRGRTRAPARSCRGSAGARYSGYGCPGRSSLSDGMVSMELGRGDPSVATFMGVHGGLAMGTLHLCASEEQKERWLPAMARMELIGAFGLTEPEHGSDVARGIETTARRDGDRGGLDGPGGGAGGGG